MFRIDFSPRRGSEFRPPEAIAAFSSSRLVIPPFSQRSLTVFGPSPGTASTSSRPMGISPRSFSCSSMRPVVAYSAIFFALAAPDPVDRLELGWIVGDGADVHGDVAEHAGDARVCGDSEPVGAGKLEDGTHLFEDGGDCFVGHG